MTEPNSIGIKNADNTEITCISLCSGYAGIELGLRRVIPNLRTVLYVEIEKYATELLVSRMEAGQIDPAPIWTDLKTLPCRHFSGKVDILTAGYPCQPFSAAGKRKGSDDPRHLWPYVLRAIRIVQPKICFFENVEGHISLGLREVLTDLAAIGYRVETDSDAPTWGLFSAAEVGAPHQRKRVFILAYNGSKRTKLVANMVENPRRKPAIGAEFSWSGNNVVNPGLLRPEECKQQTARTAESSTSVANSNPTSRHGSERPERSQRDVSAWRSKELDDTMRGRHWVEEKEICARWNCIVTPGVCQADANGAGLEKQRVGKSAMPEYPSSECGRWPARPGEEQYEWEPPRTV